MDNEKYTQTNSTNEPVHYDSCEFGERRATTHV